MSRLSRNVRLPAKFKCPLTSFLQANDALYFDGCYKTGKADNSLLCTNLALWSIGLACDHFDILSTTATGSTSDNRSKVE
ncbi:hypothetical protein F0909_07835 [Salmonella enterica]|nr:hypothetical protein [Salmonella enterica]